jgi:protein TonB
LSRVAACSLQADIAIEPLDALLAGLTAPSEMEPDAAPATADSAPSDQGVVRSAEVDAANRPPRYPRVARRLGYEGQVVLRARISAQGQCVSVAVVSSSGYPVLDRAAADAVRQWSFRPATLDGRPQASRLMIPIRFRLTD